MTCSIFLHCISRFSFNKSRKRHLIKHCYRHLLSHHLHSADVLLLLHIDVCQIEPDITDLCCGFSDLSKDVSRLSEITFMCQHSTCVIEEKCLSWRSYFNCKHICAMQYSIQTLENLKTWVNAKKTNTTKWLTDAFLCKWNESRHLNLSLEELLKPTYAIGSIQIFGIVPQNLFVDRQRSILVTLFLQNKSIQWKSK